MTLSDFFAGIDLHDSMIEQVIYKKSAEELLMIIDLLNWRQSAYKEEQEAENLIRTLRFTGVTSYKTDPNIFVIDSNDIIETRIERSAGGGRVTFILSAGFGSGVIELNIEAEHAEWQ
ncbi:hypothetical protein [Paenibacillus borealis]|uniref:Uncharacterized protein n=1 Tax=Paenibacillus borealis TaxID=160799 RepID=A0A089LEM9_PAEBO|nr:hypothetical protein [Paenibacillus borealis]AIQ57608.1 hypothetical protein PBOR_12200 [Paenibacillus borealis]